VPSDGTRPESDQRKSGPLLTFGGKRHTYVCPRGSPAG